MNPTRVWIVERCYDYEGCSIERVFSTVEAADAYAEAQNAAYGYTCNGPMNVTEWTVDEVPRATSATNVPAGKVEP